MFKINSNIDYKTINEFIKTDLKSDTIEFIIENIITYENNEKGEIDQTFFAYLILKLNKNEFVKRVNFLFDKSIDSSRIYSLQHQLEHLKKIIKQEIKLFKCEEIEIVDEDTGEVTKLYKIVSSDFLSKNELHQSGAFAFPLFISKEIESTELFFKPKTKINNSEIYKLYYDNILSEIKPKIDRNEEQKENYINEINLIKLNFVELNILNICLHPRLKLVADGGKKVNWEKNKKTIKNLIKFSQKVAKGIQELALNIETHSEEKKGVITIRSFDRKRISSLKSKSEKDYLNEVGYNWFLDINVIDLGSIDVREKYILNIKSNIKSFKTEIDKKETLSDEIKLELKENISKELNNDISVIENDKKFGFKDFFIINKSRKSLNHQKNKILTRIGLQFFTQLVTKQYDGFVKTSSGNEKSILFYRNDKKIETNVTYTSEFSDSGTGFSCLIPINEWANITDITDDAFSQDNSANKNSFDYLNEFKTVNFKSDLKEIDNKTIIRYTPNITDFDNDKYNANLNISLDFIENSDFEKSILLINYDDIDNSKLINESYWLRFLWALNETNNSVIIYNNPVDDFKEIAFYRHLWNTSNVDFWEKEKRVLFYSKKHKNNDSTSEYFRYGANLLAGSTSADFNIINNNIWNHHYSHKEDIFLFRETEKLSSEGQKQLQSILFKGKNLHYFEVLLETHTEEEKYISLFEKSVQYSLNTLFVEKESVPTNNKGYKIENTHFKLGSKIHISEFYYAKKLFQNSFFTTPLAFIISEKIKKDVSNIYDISIIGYETYSGFLVSTIRNFLSKDDNNSNKINQFIIDKNGILSRELNKLNKRIILITPIASTFNTSLRIEDQIKGIERRNKVKIGEEKDLEILQPYYNVVLVAHREDEKQLFENIINSENKVLDNKNIYHKYKWKEIDKTDKKVVIEKYNGDLKEQKYLIPVYTKWQEASECEKCFPVKIEDEQCLIETGQASITPQLIFGFPKTKPINNDIASKYGLSLKNSLLYGNLYKNDNNYLYYNRTGKIITNIENYSNIKNWLIDKIKPIFDKKHSNSKIVIVTPASGSHSKFIDLINEKVFDYRANCIVISLKEDYIENTESLYADGLHKADIVIFVDDVLSTINAFLETNYIIKYIREKNKTGKGIDYCISLINRMSYSNEENLLLKLAPLVNNQTSKLLEKIKIELDYKTKNSKNSDDLNFLVNRIEKEEVELSKLSNKLLYFTKINNASIEEANKKFPLDIERKRYKKISNSSSLDAVRTYFNNKKEALKPVNIGKNPSNDIKDYSLNKKGRKNKKLFQLLVLNALYEIFEDNGTEDSNERLKKINIYFPKVNIDEHNSFDYLDSFNKLTTEIDSKLKKDIFHKDIIETNINNLKFVIIKVICSTPLIYYKEIREMSFKWVNNLLTETITEINSDFFCLKEFFKIQPNSYYSAYRTFKFLLKKSVKLKSNLIINNDFFQTIKILLDDLNNSEKVTGLEGVKTSSAENHFKLTTELLKKYNGKEKTKIENYINDLFNEKIIETKPVFSNNVIQKKNTQIQPLFTVDEDLEKLKKIHLYKTSSAKKIIYHLVSLVQELVFDNETKAYKLDDNIRREIKKDESAYKNNIKNGDYLHYLRLLRVENTEVINSLSNYVLKKFIEYYPDQKNEIKPRNLYKTLREYDNELNFKKDDKYNLVVNDFQGENLTKNLNSYLLIKSLFNNYFLNSHYLENKSIHKKTKTILSLCKHIIGSHLVNEVCLSVNYKNKTNAEFNNYYNFYLVDKLQNEVDEDSITALFTKNIPAEDNIQSVKFSLSNLEVIKDAEGNCICRNNIFTTKIEKTTQFQNLSNDSSLLIIRISDFIKNEKGETNLYTQGILTFYLNKGQRINEKILRLLLALKQDFSKYLNTKTSGTTFLELISSEAQDKLIETNTHYLSKYFEFIELENKTLYNEITNKNENIKKTFDRFIFGLDALKAQIYNIGWSESKYIPELFTFSLNELKNWIDLILKSEIETQFNPKAISYISIDDGNLKTYVFFEEIWYIIIPQILINIKQYTDDTKEAVEILISENKLVLINKKFKEKIASEKRERQSKSKGLDLCKNITRTLNGSNNLYFHLNINEDEEFFKVEINLEKYENINN